MVKVVINALSAEELDQVIALAEQEGIATRGDTTQAARSTA